MCAVLYPFSCVYLSLYACEMADFGCCPGNRKERARTRTIATHVNNMIKGVTKGYEYKMRLVYAHFPINVNLEDGNRTVAIRNYIGEKEVMKVSLLDGTYQEALG